MAAKIMLPQSGISAHAAHVSLLLHVLPWSPGPLSNSKKEIHNLTFLKRTCSSAVAGSAAEPDGILSLPSIGRRTV
jgi:hypothetical protein